MLFRSVRVGLIPSSTSLTAAHRRLEGMLPAGWDAQHVYDHHEVMMLHGQRCCFYERPACERCSLSEVCDFYKAQPSRPQAASLHTASPQPISGHSAETVGRDA